MLQVKIHIIALPCPLWKKEVMQKIMYCFVILHKMVVNEKRPFVRFTERTAITEISVNDEMKCCFVADSTGNTRPAPGTIEAFCATHIYLHAASQYIKTRRIMIKTIVSEQTR